MSMTSSPNAAKILKAGAILLIVLGLPLGMWLPGWWGWENQPVENTQAAILIFGFIHAIVLYRRANDRSKWLWLAGIPLWFVLIARELSFGAVLFSPTSLSDQGPAFSVNQLAYKPVITPIVLALIAFSAVVIIRKRLPALGLEVLREGRAPWLSLGLVAVGMIVSSVAEGNFGFRLPIDKDSAQNVEEIIELGAYLALWAAQFEIAAALGAKRRS
jgi:hypothetical protein